MTSSDTENPNPSCDFRVSRPKHGGDIVDDRGNVFVRTKIEVWADAKSDLLSKLYYAMAEREIPPDECVGAFGWQGENITLNGIEWKHDESLTAFMAVIWHPKAVVTPCTVLDPRGVIYGSCY